MQALYFFIRSSIKRVFIGQIVLVMLLGVSIYNRAMADKKSDALSKFKQYSDTNQINACQDLFWAYFDTQPDSSYYYANYALALSKKLRFLRGEASSYRALASYYNRIELSIKEAVRYGLKAYYLYEELNYAPGLKNAAFELANAYLSTELYLYARKFNRRHVLFSKMTNDTNSILIGYIFKVGMLTSLNEFDSATYYANLYKQLNTNNRYTNGYTEAILFGLEMSKRLDKSNNQLSYEDIVALEAEFKKAIDHDRLSFRYMKHLNMANTKAKFGYYPQAYLELDSAFEIKNKVIRYDFEQLPLYNTLHQVLIKLNKHTEAYNALQKYIEIYTKREDLRLKIISITLEEQQANSDRLKNKADAEISLNEEKQKLHEKRFWLTVNALLAGILVILIAFVTVLRHKNKQLHTQNAKLERLNNELDQFAYRVSHDLRAPVSSSLGLMRVFRLETDEQLRQQYLQMAITTLEGMDNIIKDIITFTQNSTEPVKYVYFEPQKVIEQSISMLKFMPKAENLVTQIKCPPNLLILSDQERFKMIVGNLISNAIKFTTTHTNQPIIKININRYDKEVVIDIIDNGPGIPPESRSKLFQMFYRATNKAQGSGLGLFISQQAAIRMGGNITFSENPEGGTIFTLTIPQ